MAEISLIHDSSHRSNQVFEVAKILESFELQRKVILSIGLEKVDEAIAAKKPGDILISILDPGREHDKFDLIFVPKHDPHPKLANIKETVGLINHITPELLSKEEKIQSTKPIVAALIGGRHVGGNFSADDAAKLANIINKFDCTALITTSKRTEEKAIKVLKQELWKTAIFYDFNKDGQAANPYLKILASADKIIVTADSVRMCSEAASSGKQVFIFSPEKLHFSYAALRDSFLKKGAAFDISELNSRKPTVVLNEAKRVANEIIEYINAL